MNLNLKSKSEIKGLLKKFMKMSLLIYSKEVASIVDYSVSVTSRLH